LTQIKKIAELLPSCTEEDGAVDYDALTKKVRESGFPDFKKNTCYSYVSIIRKDARDSGGSQQSKYVNGPDPIRQTIRGLLPKHISPAGRVNYRSLLIATREALNAPDYPKRSLYKHVYDIKLNETKRSKSKIVDNKAAESTSAESVEQLLAQAEQSLISALSAITKARKVAKAQNSAVATVASIAKIIAKLS
jgi:hypothetical protein